MTVTCVRCGRRADEEADDFVEWEVADTSGGSIICPGCLTGEEEQAMEDDAMRLGDSLDAAGLGPTADLESMTDVELDMRESLANVLHEADG